MIVVKETHGWNGRRKALEIELLGGSNAEGRLRGFPSQRAVIATIAVDTAGAASRRRLAAPSTPLRGPKD